MSEKPKKPSRRSAKPAAAAAEGVEPSAAKGKKKSAAKEKTAAKKETAAKEKVAVTTKTKKVAAARDGGGMEREAAPATAAPIRRAEAAKSGSKGNRSRPAASGPAARPGVDEEAIRLEAYHVFEQRVRDGGRGNAVTDWLEACRRLGV